MRAFWNDPTWAAIAQQMALVPFAVLCGLDLRGERRDVRWWWLCAMFGVSWLADTSVQYHWLSGWTASAIYPFVQLVIAAFALLRAREAAYLSALVLSAAVFLFGFGGIHGPDVEFRAVAWLGILWIVVEQPWLGRVRTAALVTFGLGLIAWIVHVRTLSLWTWYPYQLTRAAGMVVFCRAALAGQPSLRLVAYPERRTPRRVA